MLALTIYALFLFVIPALAAQNPVIASRQASPHLVATRARLRAAGFARAAGPSPRVYPYCVGASANNLQGYARYVGWDDQGDDLGYGGQGYSEANCRVLCTNLRNGGNNCQGVFWWDNVPGHPFTYCFPKYSKTNVANFKDNNQAAPNGALSLLGTCADFASIVPTAMDAICCNV